MKKIFRTLTLTTTLALALAGCGASTGSVNAVKTQTTTNSDAINNMQAQLTTMANTIQTAQLAQLQAAVAANTTADAATKATIAGIITTAAAAPTTASVTALITAATATNNQAILAATANLPTTATVNQAIAAAITILAANTASTSDVATLTANINATNFSNATQAAAFSASLQAAADGNTALAAQFTALTATVNALPTTPQIATMIANAVATQAANTPSLAAVNAIVATVATHSTTLVSLQTQLDAAVAGNATLTTSVNAAILAAQNAPTLAQVQALIQTAVAGLASQTSVDAIAATVLGNSNALTVLSNSLATIQGNVSSLSLLESADSASIATMQTVIAADQATITGLLAQIATLNAQIAPLSGIVSQLNGSFNLGSWGNAPNNGTQTLFAGNAFGALKNAPATVYVTGGATVNGSSGPVVVTLDANGQAVVDLEIADGTIGSYWFTVSDLNGNPVVSAASPIGHVMTPLSTGFAPADTITWDIPPVQFGPISNLELTAHFPLGTTGTCTFSVDNGGTVAPINAPISNTGEASTLLTGDGSATAYTVSVSLDVAAPHGLAMSRVVRAKALGKRVFSQGTTLSGSVTISTAFVAWQKVQTAAAGFQRNNYVGIVANANGEYGVYSDDDGVNPRSHLQKRDTSGNVIWDIQLGATSGTTTETVGANMIATDGSNIFVGVIANQFVTGQQGFTYAFDANGVQLWKVPTSYTTLVRYSATSNTVIVGNYSAAGHVLSLNPATGATNWDNNLGAYYPDDISAAGDVYVLGHYSTIIAKRLDANTGAVVWSQTVALDGNGHSIGANAEGVYILANQVTGNQGIWKKLALADGSLIWDHSGTTLYGYQVFASAVGIYTIGNTGIQKYDFSGNLIWTVSSYPGSGLYLYGQQVYYVSSISTLTSTVGRINDVY